MFEPNVCARLRAIGLPARLQPHLPDTPGRALMRITEVQRDALTLHDGEHEHAARARPALLTALALADDGLAVGDWVLAERNPWGEWWAVERLPPSTQLARRLHDGRDKVTRVVIVANVDTALLTMALDHDFNLRRLERYLALVRLAGVGAVVVLTKADLCPDAARRVHEVQALVPPGVPVVALDARGGAPREQLAPWLEAGRTLVLLGSSGVGKSTLTNALLGADVQDTGGVRKGDARGRHTTTSRSLHVLPGGACLIDTPGLRTLRLDGESGDVQGVFDDVGTLALQCRFRDCRHEAEPGCAVREGVAPERLKSFQKLVREAQRDQMTHLERRAQLAVWKARGRAGHARAKAKRQGGDDV
jgi:ribosome biogenesis GTPase / thiamine phosphate phosphatase